MVTGLVAGGGLEIMPRGTSSHLSDNPPTAPLTRQIPAQDGGLAAGWLVNGGGGVTSRMNYIVSELKVV